MENPLSPNHFVRTLLPALRQAAAIACALEGRVPNRPKADERTPVKAALTLADTAAQEALLVPLLARFRSAHLDAEESTPSVDRFRGDATGAQIVIDPIDGTLRFFLQAEGPYAVMAGLAFGDRYEAALLALPREALFFEGVRGAGARVAQGSGRFRAAELHATDRRVMISHNLPEVVRARLRERSYEPSPGCGGAIAVAPLIPGFCGGIRVASEAASISRRGRIGLLIAAEAGALIRNGSGRPFPDSLDAPEDALLVAADEEHLEVLRATLAP
jgi:fructose-1,6-bisphosphatase/inositol monophosphatase family enzyme